MKVKILEVGPRDGLQNEVQSLTVRTRLNLVKKLTQSGLSKVEVGAFVHPHWVPQMEGSEELLKKLLRWKKKNEIKTKFTALVPNKKGMERALESGAKEVAIFGACSESFSQKNINCSIAESLKRFQNVVDLAKENKIKVRAYLSTAFGCPYEGKVKVGQVLKMTEKLFRLGAYEVSVSDTIGVANPKQVQMVTKKLAQSFDVKKIAMHFHDTEGMGLANVYSSLEEGVRSFDSCVGGLGGCPYAKGASGNICTEDLINMLHSMGAKTGIDLENLMKTVRWLQVEMGRPLRSKLAKKYITQAFSG